MMLSSRVKNSITQKNHLVNFRERRSKTWNQEIWFFSRFFLAQHKQCEEVFWEKSFIREKILRSPLEVEAYVRYTFSGIFLW